MRAGKPDANHTGEAPQPVSTLPTSRREIVRYLFEAAPPQLGLVRPLDYTHGKIGLSSPIRI